MVISAVFVLRGLRSMILSLCRAIHGCFTV